MAVGALVATMGLVASTPAQAVHDTGDFELDKDASDNTVTTPLGTLNSNITATATSIVVCQLSSTNPATPATILIDAERMTVASVANASGGGCTGTFKRTYTVARHAGTTTAAAHSGGEQVSLLTSAASTGNDWDQIFASINEDANDTGDDDKCIALGAVECAFIEDPQVPTDTSIFTTGGSKDDLDVPNWRWTTGSVPDADEILDGYAAKYVDPDTDDQILYFGADRYATNGSKDFGFWFFRNPVSVEADGTFSGEHVGTQAEPGDILILGTFTQGGATTNVRVFQWVGTGGNATANGTVEGPNATFADCVPGSGGDDGCGTVNNTTIEVTWPYLAKGENATSGLKEIPSGGFVEGGINLTQLGLEGCFSSFVAETRSSPSVDAQLKDFILGNFEACGATLSTHPGDANGDAMADGDDSGSVPDVSIGTGSVDVTDRATFAVTGTSTWTGSLSFFLCGPIATGTCDSGGVQIGSDAVIDQDTGVPYVSDPATITEAGRYCWRGVFDVDIANVANAVDSSESECFEVLPVPTQLVTDASANVEIGNPISDVATLSGTATQPGDDGPDTTYPSIDATNGAAAGGSITFNVYGPDDATCSGSVAFTSTVGVAGDDDYGSGDFTPTSAGTYRWVASYTGDSPNTLGDSGACNDADESVVVSPKQPIISTNATDGPVPLGTSLDDTATLAGTANQPDGDPAGGTITFTAYGPHDDTSTCTTVAYTSVVNVSGDGNYTASDGTGGVFTPTEAGTYNWIAVYSGDSPNTLGVSGSCGDADEGTVVISLTPSVSTSQFFYPNDSATVTVASGGNALAGDIRFRVWTNDTCDGTPLYDSGNIDITTGTGGALTRTVETSNTTARVAATLAVPNPAVYWKVDYDSTNPAHEDVSGACGDENSLITIDNG